MRPPVRKKNSEMINAVVGAVMRLLLEQLAEICLLQIPIFKSAVVPFVSWVDQRRERRHAKLRSPMAPRRG